MVPIDPIQRLHHHHRVAADHAHAQARLLVVGLALGRFVEHEVEKDLEGGEAQTPQGQSPLRREVSPRKAVGGTNIEAPQEANDFSRAVELDFDPFVEILGRVSWRGWIAAGV